MNTDTLTSAENSTATQRQIHESRLFTLSFSNGLLHRVNIVAASRCTLTYLFISICIFFPPSLDHYELVTRDLPRSAALVLANHGRCCCDDGRNHLLSPYHGWSWRGIVYGPQRRVARSLSLPAHPPVASCWATQREINYVQSARRFANSWSVSAIPLLSVISVRCLQYLKLCQIGLVTISLPSHPAPEGLGYSHWLWACVFVGEKERERDWGLGMSCLLQ